jgi:hypothetical protein
LIYISTIFHQLCTYILGIIADTLFMYDILGMFCLFVYLLFYVPLKNFSRIFYGDVTIVGERLQNLGLCSALRAFEQGGIFIVPRLLWHGASVFPVSSEGLIQSPLTTHKGIWRTYSNPDPYGSPFSRLLLYTRGYGRPILLPRSSPVIFRMIF